MPSPWPLWPGVILLAGGQRPRYPPGLLEAPGLLFQLIPLHLLVLGAVQGLCGATSPGTSCSPSPAPAAAALGNKPPHQSTPCGRKPDELHGQSLNQHGKHNLGYRISTHNEALPWERPALHRAPSRVISRGFRWPVARPLFPHHHGAGGARGA